MRAHRMEQAWPHRAAPLAQGALLLAMLALAGCGTAPKLSPAPQTRPTAPAPAAGAQPRAEPGVPALPAAGSGRGGYYQDDGPGDSPPPNLLSVPDAEVRNDPLLPRSNRPYVVFGKTYTPLTGNQPYSEIGIGSWYGKKFHGQRTSSGELYDMYKMTAAHPTLPIPSYARLTNLISGAQVIVRINDRGPFHSSRAIDVSYTAALKLGLLSKGSHELKIDRILPDEAERIIAARAAAPVRTQLTTPQSTLSVQPLVLAPRAVPKTGLGLGALSPAAVMPAPAYAPVSTLAAATTVAEAATMPAPRVPVSAPPAAASADVDALMLAARSPGEAAAAGVALPLPVAAGDAPALKSGYYLQLGAYSRAENAEAARVKVAQTTNNFSTLEVVQSGPVLRLFGGPFASRQEATQAAQGLPSSLNLKPIVIQR
ncbi:septal ring lytic transglycosylase RlpA family protein [Rugamonas sp.]|uniref:septal ring lytic transglycosylase RlpA family protein n=1 Tax=Rugamonas sp. TaxID=1926287 RepID=UPI0025E378A8|nr:septal ring lytic transglycosylase RlpA family protein [Rugamonas sp.]